MRKSPKFSPEVVERASCPRRGARCGAASASFASPVTCAGVDQASVAERLAGFGI